MLRSPALLVPYAALGLLAAVSPDAARPARAEHVALFSSHHASCSWRGGDTLVASGTIETGGLTGRFVRRVEAGSGRLFETDDLGIVVTRDGFDGAVAWSQDMSGGLHDLSSRFARSVAKSMAWLDARQGCTPSKLHGMARVGSRTEHGRRFVAWRAAPAGGVPFELWYDARSGRVDRAFFQMTESRLIRHFGDWRDIGGGRWVAFEQRDEFPEDEDEIVRRISTASVRERARSGDFARPRPPKDLTLFDGKRSTIVSFEDDHRTRIYIPVYLNGKGPFLFELDSGGHNILTTETAEAIGLSPMGAFSSTGAGSAVAQSGIARVSRMQIGDLVLTDQAVKIRKFSPASNDRTPNAPRAGILGLELFERLVLAIDPKAKTVTLSRFGSTKRPRGVALPLVFAEDAPLITGSYRGATGDFMLDTGNAGPTIIEDYWARRLGFSAALDKGLARGDVKLATATIGLGPLKLRNELISYYGPAERGSEYSRAVAGVYGEPLLSRFKSTYDYSRKKVWLEPFPNIGPLPFDRSGLSLGKVDSGTFKVSAVATGSPADVAGIHTEDLVTAVDGIPAYKLSRADAAATLRQTPGEVVVLSGRFGGTDGVKRITLRELVNDSDRGGATAARADVGPK